MRLPHRIETTPALIIGVTAFFVVDMVLLAEMASIFFDDTKRRIEKVATPFQLPDLKIPIAVAERATVTDSIIAISRPAFSSTRRPFEPPPPPPPPTIAPPPQPTSPPPDLVIDGIWLGGSVRKAHLRKRGESSGEWHTEGESVEGWVITEITASRVALALDAQRYDIDLYPSSIVNP